MTTRKITLTFPVDLLEKLRTMVPKRQRSKFIAEATRQAIVEKEREALREELKAGAIARAKEDLAMAEEWFPVEQEVWDRYLDDERARGEARP